MANLKTSMDAAFYDVNIATPQTLYGSARSIPGDPIPLDGSTASKLLRVQQLSLLGHGFPLGIIPSYAPPLSSSSSTQKEPGSGSLSLQSLWLNQPAENWWVGLIGQIRPIKLLSSIKAEAFRADTAVSKFKHVAKKFLDKSLYSTGLCSHLNLSESTSVLLNVEKDFRNKNQRTKAVLLHKLPNHDITLEAAWPELFVDRNGKYWEMPESISLDCLSLVSESGLRYRIGIHKNGGPVKAVDFDNGQVGQLPASLSPGVCAKAAFSYEKSKDIWIKPETKEDLVLVKREGGEFRNTAYDIRMKEPHATISGIFGGMCEAWASGPRSPFGADLFGSVCFAIQHGKFRKPYGDLTRFDARLDLSSASALVNEFSNTLKSSSVSPQLNLILQQQIAGPIVFRVNSKVSFGSSNGERGPHIEDTIYSLNYSMRYLGSGKVVAWYSPKRNEGMIEMRVFEF